MASKYAKALATLPKSTPSDVEYQGKVEAEKIRLRMGEVPFGPEYLATEILKRSLNQWPSRSTAAGSAVSFTPESLAKLYLQVREELDELEAVRYQRQVRVAALEQMLIESHEQDTPGWGLYGASEDAIKLPNGMTVTVGIEPDVKVADKEQFRKWCVANGLEEALQLWPSTTASITKQRLLAGVALPDGVAVTVRSKVTPRKPRGEGEQE